MNAQQLEEMKADYDLLFSKSGDSEWTSRNNNYIITRTTGPAKFAVAYLGQPLTSAKTLKAAMRHACNDQVDRLYR